MATVKRWLRLPSSPIENSIEGRAFVFSGFVVAALAIVLYGQDYVVPELLAQAVNLQNRGKRCADHTRKEVIK